MKRFVPVILAALISVGSAQLPPASVRYQWKHVNFTWPSGRAHDEALTTRDYIPENNSIVGIKIWKNRVYLTNPRWKDGVPATLLVVPDSDEKSPLLMPYPNWAMQAKANCSAFQFVQSMEIDPLGRMWAIDTGRVGIWSDNPKNYCPPRLVILDLESEGRVLLDYPFPEDVARRDTNYLNDIVLESEGGGYAYITDTDSEYPGIIVFSLATRTSRKVTDKTMKATAPNITVVYDCTSVSRSLNVDGLALSPASIAPHLRKLYYSPPVVLGIIQCPYDCPKVRSKY